jgi:hypothetical protein
MIPKINIRELKDCVTLFFYDELNCGLEELKVISNLCEKLGKFYNEQIDLYYHYNYF